MCIFVQHSQCLLDTGERWLLEKDKINHSGEEEKEKKMRNKKNLLSPPFQMPQENVNEIALLEITERFKTKLPSVIPWPDFLFTRGSSAPTYQLPPCLCLQTSQEATSPASRGG